MYLCIVVLVLIACFISVQDADYVYEEQKSEAVFQSWLYLFDMSF